MENPIIVPFDLNTARKIKSGEIEGSVLIGNIKIEFVYESKDCASSQAVAWYVVFSSGLTGTGNKHIGDMVRTVIDF